MSIFDAETRRCRKRRVVFLTKNTVTSYIWTFEYVLDLFLIALD